MLSNIDDDTTNRMMERGASLLSSTRDGTLTMMIELRRLISTEKMGSRIADTSMMKMRKSNSCTFHSSWWIYTYPRLVQSHSLT